jgi:hypothetical protein
VRAASDGQRVLFVWGHADESTDPIVSRHLARSVDAASGEKSALRTIFERENAVLAPPAVARDTQRCRFLIVWQESDNQQIWGRLEADDGSTLRDRFQITTTEAGSGSPHLAFSTASSTFLLGYGSWLDAEAWVVELGATGDPLGPARSMHDAPPQNGTYFQDIASGQGHALAISNEDYNRIEGALFEL